MVTGKYKNMKLYLENEVCVMYLGQAASLSIFIIGGQVSLFV